MDIIVEFNESPLTGLEASLTGGRGPRGVHGEDLVERDLLVVLGAVLGLEQRDGLAVQPPVVPPQLRGTDVRHLPAGEGRAVSTARISSAAAAARDGRASLTGGRGPRGVHGEDLVERDLLVVLGAVLGVEQRDGLAVQPPVVPPQLRGTDVRHLPAGEGRAVSTARISLSGISL
ncbi:hypothetical protein ACJJTC_005268 [Scirpophaga incertulas]